LAYSLLIVIASLSWKDFLVPISLGMSLMPAKHYIDDETKLIITTWEGDAVDVEFLDALKRYQEEIQMKPELVNFNEVANFCNIDSMKITPTGLKSIGEIAAKTDSSKLSSRLAIVVGSGVAFNLARLYASYRGLQKNSRKEIRIFRSEEEAMEWARGAEQDI
jgi:hypothetical protein